MKHEPIPPLRPGVTQPTGVKALRSLAVKNLRDDLRSPKLPKFERSTVIVSSKTKFVRSWTNA